MCIVALFYIETTHSSSSSTLNTGTIIGIAVGLSVLLTIVVAACVIAAVFLKHRQKDKKEIRENTQVQFKEDIIEFSQ